MGTLKMIEMSKRVREKVLGHGFAPSLFLGRGTTEASSEPRQTYDGVFCKIE